MGKVLYPIFIKDWLYVSLGIMYIVLNGRDGVELCTQIWDWGEEYSFKGSALAGADNEESC